MTEAKLVCAMTEVCAMHDCSEVCAMTEVIFLQYHIFDANYTCICICLSDWHQTNIFLAHCHLLPKFEVCTMTEICGMTEVCALHD